VQLQELRLRDLRDPGVYCAGNHAGIDGLISKGELVEELGTVNYRERCAEFGERLVRLGGDLRHQMSGACVVPANRNARTHLIRRAFRHIPQMMTRS
jgi:hypothetical protein